MTRMIMEAWGYGQDVSTSYSEIPSENYRLCYIWSKSCLMMQLFQYHYQ